MHVHCMCKRKLQTTEICCFLRWHILAYQLCDLLCVQVEVGCLPAFETRADFAAYTFADADQSAPHVHGSSAAIVGLVAMLTAAVAVHM